ncbi:IWS1 Cterminus domain containing protein [Acanthamoeba castellanii str. Neff]|uniref:IWS1 Cterminus domain containing protein n=1 Tax=Acanthamoeba castellanii (strain ATCC 30010 / Neff) TaxID=1257118 RepID=L8HIQ8_ACACF|nr:IWS1 Cterminus domain containing protein [Acanthamoeba castellanii str. Neff]ELR25077.1 IWS1 Cterminus domain containing protein [Acanthamoeba castellanii str. Neff]
MDGDHAALPHVEDRVEKAAEELFLNLDGTGSERGVDASDDERSEDVSSIVADDSHTNGLEDDLGEKEDLNSSVAVAARIEEENSVDPFEVDELEKLLDGGAEGNQGNRNGEGEGEQESNLEEVPMEEELFLEGNGNGDAPASPALQKADEGAPAESAESTSETAATIADDNELDGLLSDLEGDGDGATKKKETKEDDDFELGEEEQEGEMGEKKDETRAALLESIFGGDDDDDDLGELLVDEDAGGFIEDEKKSKKKKKTSKRGGKRKADSEDSDIEKKTKRRLEEILQQKDKKEKKKERGSKKRRQSHADAEFEEVLEIEEEEASTTKKRRRRASAGDDAPKRKRRSKKSLEAGEEGEGGEGEGEGVEKSDFDLVVEQMKKSNRRRKSMLSREQIDQMVETLLNKMGDAVDADIRAIQENSPAVAKVKLLPEVIAMLQKVQLQESFVEGGGLRAVKQWLEPVSGALPNYNIRTSLLNILPKLHIDSDHLRESGLGKVVMFLWKSPKETKENKIIAQELIQTWSRPIFQLSLNYKEHADHERKQLQRQDSYRRSNSSQSQSASQTDDSLDSIVGSRSSGASQKEEFSYHARIPQPADKDYVHRPVSQVEVPMQPASSKNAPTRQKMFDRRLSELKLKRKGRSITAQSRAAKLSVEGRNLHI